MIAAALTRKRPARWAVVLTLAVAGPVAAGIVVSDAWITVSGRGNTLTTLAQQVGDSAAVNHEEALGVTQLGRSLRIAGEMRMGGTDDPEGLFRYDHLVEMDVAQCGQARVQVLGPDENSGRAGTLELIRTKLTAFHPEKDLDECKDANLLSVRGNLRLEDSLVVGNIDCEALDGARVDIANSTISFCRNHALDLRRVKAQDVNVRDSYLLDSALYGLSAGEIEGTLRAERCVFRGLGADVYVRDGTELALVDCDFKSLKFAGLSGSVRRKWTVTVRTGAEGLRVAARSAGEAGKNETVRATTGDDGSCQLELTEYLATPANREAKAGVNTYTPHDLTVYSADGKTPLWRVTNYRVFMAGQEVSLP